MSEARRSVVRLPDSREMPDQRIDASLSVPIASRSSWLLVRAGALIVAAALALTFLPSHSGLVVAGILAADALVQALLAGAAKHRDISALVAINDIVTAAAVAAVDARLWTPAIVWMVSVSQWQSITGTARRSIALLALAISAVCVSGWESGHDGWWMTVVTLAILGSAYIAFGHATRRDIHAEEVETLETISLGGALVHRSDLDTGSTQHLRGDVFGITGYTPEEWISLDHRTLVHPDDIDTFWLWPDEVEPNTMIDRVGRYRRADGSWVWLRDVSRVQIDRRGHRTIRGIVIDVTESEEHRIELARLARLDLLTGLPNRHALHEELETRLGGGDPFVLLLLDLDRFKEVNDTLGHEAGDDVLRIIAARLGEGLCPGDLLARIGGDEFAMVIEGLLSPSEIEAHVERISAACSAPVTVHNIELALSQSCGIAHSTSVADRATLMRHADIAMYSAKRAAISHRVFDSSLEQSSTMQLSLSADLTAAIERREIELYYQPKIDMRTGRIVGAEGLVRWRHPDFGLLSPAGFLELALLSESSNDLLRSTLDQAVEMIRCTSDIGRPIPIAANIAFASIRDIGFSDDLDELVARHGVAPGLLTLEFTENDVDRPSDETVAVVNRLSARGFKISIDDFGTGHSSLERLLTLQVDELKIDRIFVRRVLEDGLERKIIQTIVDLAARLGARVVAEGVETDEQADALTDIGCPVAQGFLFAPALPAEEFIELVRHDAAHGSLVPS